MFLVLKIPLASAEPAQHIPSSLDIFFPEFCHSFSVPWSPVDGTPSPKLLTLLRRTVKRWANSFLN